MNYYELLEITPNASREVVKAAYKVQVAKYHSEDELMGVEQHNLDVIVNYEKKMGYR